VFFQVPKLKTFEITSQGLLTMKIKQKIFEIIQPGDSDHLASQFFDCFIMALIVFSVISVFMLTFKLTEKITRILSFYETLSAYVFTVEYLLRIWTADLLYPGLTPGKARLRYVASGMAVIDLLAILPFYLPMILPINLLELRAVRLVRLLRIFKFNRYSDAFVSIMLVLKKKTIAIVTALFLVLILLVISSLLIYYVEHDAQPDKFQNAFSGLWWAVSTLTTVGYGDIYPITVAGKILGAFIAILGIGIVAVPTGILSAGFVERIDKPENTEIKYCPHCGKKIK